MLRLSDIMVQVMRFVPTRRALHMMYSYPLRPQIRQNSLRDVNAMV